MTLNLQPRIEESRNKPLNYEPEPTWMEQATAAKDQVVASGLTTSSMIYSGEALGRQLDDMTTEDPDNSEVYETMRGISGKQLDLYEHYFNEGKLEHFARGTGGATPQVLNTYFTQVKALDKYDAKGLYNVGVGYAAKDHYEAGEVLKKGDSITAQLAGGMAGAMMDPVNLALLPVGGAVVKGAGQTIAGTAARAAGQELGIATAAEALIQPKIMNWNEELGVKYGIKEAATNAALSIGAAGLVRGTGSAMFDLTEEGLKALKVTDPKLASEYEEISIKNISTNTTEHIDNLSRVELGEEVAIKEPGELATELKNAPPAKEFKEVEPLETPLIDHEGDLQIITGKTASGEDTYASYKDIDEALNEDLNRLKQIEDCILKG